MSLLAPRKVYTLVFLTKESSILLGYKKRGFGKGKWIGFGGKVEEGETIFNGALREVKEECGLEPLGLTKAGSLEFEFMGKPDIMYVYVFKSEAFEGELQESEEMKPSWFQISNIPYDNMWPDDKHWLPLLLTHQNFHGYFLYDDEETILEKRVKVLKVK